jgi:uncharacterized protein YecT (DUF1311 family)
MKATEFACLVIICTFIFQLDQQTTQANPLAKFIGQYLLTKASDYIWDKATGRPDLVELDRRLKELQDTLDRTHPNLVAPIQDLRQNITPNTSQEDFQRMVQKVDSDLRQKIVDFEQRLANLEKDIQNRSGTGGVETNRPKLPAMLKAPSPLPPKPSFDCNKARTNIEITICTNPTLASVDGRLGQVYWAARNTLPSHQSQRLRQEQIAWISERDALLSRVCTLGGRIDIDCALGFWNLRIAQLESLLR